jgi:A/G-specific adenine glycosylase
LDAALIRRKLVRWYERHQRDLPWRNTRDPYAIWISEIMLQQTRVAAVIPYYRRFLETFPGTAQLAAASEKALLTMWSGLGYYSRARNLQKAARQIEERGAFPSTYEEIRELPGVGDYTAAAVASIAFGLPHAAVDGNVRRVIARLTNGKGDPVTTAGTLLDRKDPSRWNQAMMELGATVCLPREPLCSVCPVAQACEAFRHGTQRELPLKRQKPQTIFLEKTLLVIRRKGRLLLTQSGRVKGFWDLPETFEGARLGAKLGEFRHAITHRSYHFTVCEAVATKGPAGCRWFAEEEIEKIPLSTAAKKGLRCLNRGGETSLE